jgi:hypothetical protein
MGESCLTACGWGDCSHSADWDTPLCVKHLIRAWAVVKENREAVGLTAPGSSQVHRKARTGLESVVYYVRLKHGPIKIGYTTSVSGRVRGLRLTMPNVLAVEPDGRAKEKFRHEQFAALRIGTPEDFTDGPDLLALIAELRAHFGNPADVARLLGEANRRVAEREVFTGGDNRVA